MTVFKATPSDLRDVVKQVGPGDAIELTPGKYGRIDLVRLRGRRGSPIIIRGGRECVFDGGQRFEDFRLEANQIAKRAQDENRYPSLGRDAHRGFIRLKNCRDVVLRGFSIRGCWPTGLYLSNCTDIEIDNLDIAEGTFGIFADGRRTQRLTIHDCKFVQDVERKRIWREIDWKFIHGDQTVDIERDARAFDGEFFRSFGISGDVTIADNLIEHAFNGIHMFHSDREGYDRAENRDVRIHGNSFRYVRDNAIEPEWGATNWWVFHNQMFNCHKWYSLEVERSGFFYIFGNTGFFDELPGPAGDLNKGGAVFKLEKRHKGTGGMHYVFNNSYYLRSAYIKKNRLQNLAHFNNAILYCAADDHGAGTCYERGFFGGALGDSDDNPPEFNKDWTAHNIRFFNDFVDNAEYPEKLEQRGYPLEDSRPGDPGFTNGREGNFRPSKAAPIVDAGVGFEIGLVDGNTWKLPPNLNAGAWQGNELIAPPPQIPTTGRTAFLSW